MHWQVSIAMGSVVNTTINILRAINEMNSDILKN